MKTTPTRSFLLALALAAVALPGFAAEPVNIARLQTTTIKSYKSDGTDLNGGGFHNSAPLSNLYNGKLADGARANGIGNKGYVVFDFGGTYFISTIDVVKLYRYKYSLYYSPSSSGDNWIPVAYSSNVNRIGTKTWGVYAGASRVKFVFEEGGGFVPDVAEIEVWGVLASEMACPHSNLSAWTEVAGSATCTKPALESATCSDCGESFIREGNLPLGHDYKANVVKTGKGWFACARCNHCVDCSNGAIEMISLGGMSFDDSIVQFSDVLTSTHHNNEAWGTRDDVIVDGNLSTAFGPSVRGAADWYIEVSFGATISMESIDLTLSGTEGLPDTVRITKLDDGVETDLYEQVHKVSSASPTVSIPFAETEVDAIRIHLHNTSNWNDYSNVSEVRVYGTVPGAVNYIPALILMQ